MEKNQKIYSVSQLYDLKQADIQSKINDWLVMSRLLLEPDKMLINGKEQLFDQNQLKRVISSFGMKEDFWLQLKNSEEETTLHLLSDTLFEKYIIKEKNFYYWERVYLDYLKNRLIDHGFFLTFVPMMNIFIIIQVIYLNVVLLKQLKKQMCYQR